MQIQYTNQLDLSNGVKCLLYGTSGIGKTSQLATAPRPFIFNAEKGLLSLQQFKIPYVTVSTFKELDDAFAWAVKSNEARNYDTFGLDSLSEIAEVINAFERKKNPDARKWSPAAQDSVYHLVRAFRDLPRKHVVCIAKQTVQDFGDLSSGVTKQALPMMPGGKLTDNMPYFWDAVLHMTQGVTAEGNQWRGYHTSSSPYWQAKDRSGKLAPLEYPDLTNLFNKAMGKATKY